MIKFDILGEPVAKGRPRVTRWGCHTPKKTVNYENLVKLSFMQAKQPKLDGMLSMIVDLYFKIPKSVSKTKRQQMIDGEIRPQKKPDLDNCLKAISDALNDLAYDDDKQIVHVSVSKYYSEEPRAEVKIHEI